MQQTFSKSIVSLDLDNALIEKRNEAKQLGVPVADDETMQYLCVLIRALQPKKILEIGTAVGLSGTAMLLCAKDARLTTIEVDEDSYCKAKENFRLFGVEDRVVGYLNDAADVLSAMPKELNGTFDFIFLDGPKAQYLNYLPDLKRLLKKGGVLFSDDILLYGWVDGEPPQKRRALIEKIRDYLRAICSDNELSTSILQIGDGVAVSVRL